MPMLQNVWWLDGNKMIHDTAFAENSLTVQQYIFKNKGNTLQYSQNTSTYTMIVTSAVIFDFTSFSGEKIPKVPFLIVWVIHPTNFCSTFVQGEFETVKCLSPHSVIWEILQLCRSWVGLTLFLLNKIQRLMAKGQGSATDIGQSAKFICVPSFRQESSPTYQ